MADIDSTDGTIRSYSWRLLYWQQLPERVEMKRTAIVAVCLLVAVVVITLPEASPAQRGAPPTPTNLQVLPEGVDIRTVMQNIAMSLGVQCTYCHVQGDFASDDVDKKNIARGMMRMLQTINNDFLSNIDAQANCMMCHRGEAMANTD